ADPVREALERSGVPEPWTHQCAAADLAHAGRHVVISTGTASGKSLCYLLPGLQAIETSRGPKGQRGASVLYLAPTKALAQAQILRRLRRVAALYGAHPTFVLASATAAEPAASAGRLTGLDVTAVTDDGSPRGRTALALWEPPFVPGVGENGAPVRRSAISEV